jgi:signal transduction histidine kinase
VNTVTLPVRSRISRTMDRSILRLSIAIAIATIGGVVTLGWLAHVPALVQLAPGLAAMTLTTALCFLLVGVALLASEVAPSRGPRIQLILAIVAGIIAGAMLIEILGDISLGVDLPWLQTWLDPRNPRPGRMSINTAIGFLLAGAVLTLMSRVRGTLGAVLLRVLVLCIIGIGATGLTGYALGTEFIYNWYGFTSMALHTAAGMTLVGIALLLSLRRLNWYQQLAAMNPAGHVAAVAAGWLVIVALSAGLIGFVVMQQRAEQNLSDTLRLGLHNRAELFESLISLRATNATLIATRPALLTHLRALVNNTDNAPARNAVAEVAASFLPGGFSGVAIYAPNGGEIARAGRFTERPDIKVRVNAANAADLIWKDGFILRTQTTLSDGAGLVGTAVAEQHLPVLTKSIDDVAALGATGDAGICGSEGQALMCFPQHLRREAFTFARPEGGDPLPIVLALEGKSGVARTTDYRGKSVVAAFGPIGELGLGMSLKVDAAEIYQPVRDRLALFAPALLVLIVAGAFVLRAQVKPVVVDLVMSREALRQRTHELQQANIALEDASKAKDHFLASMSHELRTPLNAILGFTGVLLMKLPGPLNDEQERQLGTVQRSAQHLLSLINDLLNVVQIRAGKVATNPERVVCQDVLNEVVDALRPLAASKGLTLEGRYPDADVSTTTDRRALLQIVMNLTNNAIKYTNTGSIVITLSQRLEDESLRTDISVSDTGVGIKPQDEERLFAAFSRVGGAIERDEGTGLGLYLSRMLCDMIGGRLTLTSMYGRGSTFTLTLVAPAPDTSASGSTA